MTMLDVFNMFPPKIRIAMEAEANRQGRQERMENSKSYEEIFAEKKYTYMKHMLSSMFNWQRSVMGDSYWRKLYQKIEKFED